MHFYFRGREHTYFNLGEGGHQRKFQPLRLIYTFLIILNIGSQVLGVQTQDGR